MLASALLLTKLANATVFPGTVATYTADTTAQTATNVGTTTKLEGTPALSIGNYVEYAYTTSNDTCTAANVVVAAGMPVHGVVGVPGATASGTAHCSRSSRARNASGVATLASNSYQCVSGSVIVNSYSASTDCTGATTAVTYAAAVSDTCDTVSSADVKRVFNCAAGTAVATVALASRSKLGAVSTTDACGQQITKNCYVTGATASETFYASTTTGKTFRVIYTASSTCTGAPNSSYELTNGTCYTIGTNDAIVNPGGTNTCDVDFDTLCGAPGAASDDDSSASKLTFGVALLTIALAAVGM